MPRTATVRSVAARPAALQLVADRTAKAAPPAHRTVVGRIPVTDVSPVVAAGRLPAKAVVGERFEIAATVFREGHDRPAAHVVLRDPRGRDRAPLPLREQAPGTDRWTATAAADLPGRWSFTVEAWADPVGAWRHEAEVKLPAGTETALVLEEGARLLDRAARALPPGRDRRTLLAAAATVRTPALTPGERYAAAVAEPVRKVLDRHPLRELLTTEGPFPLQVDRRRALYGSWYEFFPRSEGARPGPDGTLLPGTLRTAAERLPAVAEMGFDVVYLPPVHPIGERHRKGPGNTLTAGPGDVGSPWAVGSAAGGHDAVHPDLGTLDDFDAFVARARSLGLETALDFALQCSPDHPWLTEHPAWFRHRADGTIAHAENPPKKYQDIHPVDFDTDFDGIVAETLRLLRFWAARGVRIFRVDNPHTKPVPFWETVLADMARTDPDVLFLAEAFTRPAMLRTLAQIGFHQSYTYFTWRDTKRDLTDYLTELSRETAHYLRPNLFVNTPDILPRSLVAGGRAAFEQRAVLAATLSPAWGVYAGYELCENVPAGEGSEEYADSEKYQLRPRDWAAADRAGTTIAPLIGLLNRVRRAHPALQDLRSLRFHRTDNDQVVAYSKQAGDDLVLTVVSLDPHGPQEATVSLDLPALGLDWDVVLDVHDELTGTGHRWTEHNYVRLAPGDGPASAHVLAVRRADA
ncbi:alpha-1,4-glucan--maltose-1-phosphate maltosyltransferase [Streptomyces sp. NPDC058955]|uniref:alpha-1,4-glucan--maltose-1-phosphate maltosyltransferase n=1 Tax=Streptomyces sp. NPDC058955 TaxID=3346678 RepID=UPI00369A4402